LSLSLGEGLRVRPTYWLTRFVILRLLGVIYAIAFLVAINQIVGPVIFKLALDRSGETSRIRAPSFPSMPPPPMPG